MKSSLWYILFHSHCP